MSDAVNPNAGQLQFGVVYSHVMPFVVPQPLNPHGTLHIQWRFTLAEAEALFCALKANGFFPLHIIDATGSVIKTRAEIACP